MEAKGPREVREQGADTFALAFIESKTVLKRSQVHFGILNCDI